MAPEQTTIQAKWINPIAPGKKFGSIVDSTDNKWMCSDAALVGKGTKDNHTNGSVQKGQTVTFSYAEQQWGASTVNVIIEVLDEAPRTAGTQAPPLPGMVMDKDCRIFVCGFLQSLYQGTGTFPGREMLGELILETRSAYEWAFSQPLRQVNPPQARAQQPPSRPPIRQTNYEARDPREGEYPPL